MRKTFTNDFALPNVTPMIDVLLVLLIVFMVLVIRVHRTLDVQLPASAGEGGSSGIVLEVLPGSTFRINSEFVPGASLEPRLTAIYRDRPDKVIHVAGTPGVKYREVTAAVDVARSAGVKVVGIHFR